MDNFILDNSQEKTLQISNDAFYYLYYDEEPLDENNLIEAKNILAMFSNGFFIKDNWKALKNSDLIEATFIPYIKQEIDYDEYFEITKYIQLQIKWIDTNLIRMWRHNMQNGSRELCGDFKVYTNNYGHKCFHTGLQDNEFITGKMSLYFLKNFKRKFP